ncbi:EamA family transporter [Cyanobium sp. ATX-6F1]|uniref:EamA family transporter n=1 Tax=Cyanobium sp. ATX-6F1 TaxID=3137388 RepID=UPI0039BDB3B5
MAIGVAAALAAALFWTLASGLWRRLPTSLGPAELNLLKNLIALALQLPLLLGSTQALPLGPTGLLLLSGVLGIALGDSFYFAALRRLGTRRTLTFDAGGPAVTAAAGCLLLAEWPGPRQWLGIALISLAVVVVARQRPMAEAGVVWRLTSAWGWCWLWRPCCVAVLVPCWPVPPCAHRASIPGMPPPCGCWPPRWCCCPCWAG